MVIIIIIKKVSVKMYSMAGISEKRSYRGIGRAREAVDKGGRMRGARSCVPAEEDQ